jgi:transcriptional regulator with XRE-family HTH domain
MTQAQLARAMSTTQPVIARAEAGNRMPTIAFIDRWARATGSPLNLTFGERPVALSSAEKAGLVDRVLGPDRFNPWDRKPSAVEAELLERSGRDRAYFRRLRSRRGRPARTPAR